MQHQSVLGEGYEPSVFNVLQPQEGDIVLDATVGLGGHAEGFLTRIGNTGRLFTVDADEVNLQSAKERLSSFTDQCAFMHGNFRDIGSMGIPLVDVILADLGLSSPHLDDASRGFSFHHDAPLDLRFDRTRGVTGAEILADASELEMKRILKENGELRESGRIAATLYREVRRGSGIATTGDLRRIIERLFGYRAAAILPQVFQALRIAVNDELGALREFLDAAPNLLKPGGRMGIISFHSLEDRMVKEKFRSLATPIKDPRTGAVAEEALFTLLTRKPIVPSDQEVQRNSRARSAKFRAITKTR